MLGCFHVIDNNECFQQLVKESAVVKVMEHVGVTRSAPTTMTAVATIQQSVVSIKWLYLIAPDGLINLGCADFRKMVWMTTPINGLYIKVRLYQVF